MSHRETYFPKAVISNFLEKEGVMTNPAPQEEYAYQGEKITFFVTPVYQETGESMYDILLKLMLSELEF